MLAPKMRNETEDKDKDARLVTGTQKPARQEVPILAPFSNVYRPICVSFASGEHVQTRKNAPHLTSTQNNSATPGYSKYIFFARFAAGGGTKTGLRQDRTPAPSPPSRST